MLATTSGDVVARIAHEVGVSPRTVSRVLHSELRDTRPTIVRRAQRIRDLADRLQYRPNAAARAMSTGRFKAVALLTAGPMSDASLRLQAGVLAALAARDLHLVVDRLSEGQEAERLPKILRQLLADGLLIDATGGVGEAVAELVAAHRAPAIWVGVRRKHDCVYADDLGAGKQATKHLLERGHKRIAFVDFAGDQPGDVEAMPQALRDRRGGYESAMAEAGLAANVLPTPRLTEQADRLAFAEKWLRGGLRPTAILTPCRSVLGPVLFAARGLGIRVPDAISLATIDDAALEELGPKVTTFVSPMASMGKLAVERLVEKVDEPERRLPAAAVAFTLEAGATVSGRAAG